MIARYAGAVLGLLAFTITVIAGIYARNPATVTLSRSILALFLFCVIGLVLGGAAQMVVAEHGKEHESNIRKRFEEASSDAEEAESKEPSTGSEALSAGA